MLGACPQNALNSRSPAPPRLDRRWRSGPSRFHNLAQCYQPDAVRRFEHGAPGSMPDRRTHQRRRPRPHTAAFQVAGGAIGRIKHGGHIALRPIAGAVGKAALSYQRDLAGSDEAERNGQAAKTGADNGWRHQRSWTQSMLLLPVLAKQKRSIVELLAHVRGLNSTKANDYYSQDALVEIR